MITHKEFDYLIVGAGLFGSVMAHELTKKGYKCLVIDKRNHIGGNTYCERMDGITVHKYGAHIFHTNEKKIWEYVNGFVEFNNYRHTVLAKYKDSIFNLPFNMNTFYQLWGVTTPADAVARINGQIKSSSNPSNLEEQTLSLVGTDIYNILVKGYTEKQWGRASHELPSFIIKRLPLRFTYCNDYFNDIYQGIPIGGYNHLINGLLKGIEVRLDVDYLKNRYTLDDLANNIVFTGAIDAFYGYRFGQLEYRTIKFVEQILPIENFQGAAVVNYTEANIPYTRIIEHKHFDSERSPSTVITYEYPKQYESNDEPFYPINDELNNNKYLRYRQLAINEPNIIFGGRLAEYKYYDMHQVIGSALAKAKKIPQKKLHN